ncbi:MAG: lycopene cyclase family protein [Anaerolineae bacterium]|nr:lycopene cyclase family protein [Anaerolineae bacterium]
MYDALVVGAGPAGLAIAAALAEAGLRVQGLAPADPAAPWQNTFGIWADELEPLGLAHLLRHRWSDCSAYADGRELRLGRDYGLLDNRRLQAHLLEQCRRGGVVWHRGEAVDVRHTSDHSVVLTKAGDELTARLVVDASGHRAALLRRPPAHNLAFQAAYGIVGVLEPMPVRPGQMVLMDWRVDHLTPAEQAEPPSFLYAMDLGDGVTFVEETSLALCPPMSLDVLRERLRRRLAHRGVEVRAVHHVEHVLFPMNLPLPDLDQPLLGYGAAASLVHPATGYQVNQALRLATPVARAVAQALGRPDASPRAAAQAGWNALWPAERLRKRYIYLFGLEATLRFSQRELQSFFSAFFQLPRRQWAGYLSDTHALSELLEAMLTLFSRAPNHVRIGLLRGLAREDRRLLLKALTAARA